MVVSEDDDDGNNLGQSGLYTVRRLRVAPQKIAHELHEYGVMSPPSQLPRRADSRVRRRKLQPERQVSLGRARVHESIDYKCATT